MADRLAALLSHFSVSAQVFHAGALCGINQLDDGQRGQLHLVRRGTVEVHNGDGSQRHIDQPSLLLYPRPLSHRFVTDPQVGAEFACAHLSFSGGAASPIVRALPTCICLPLEALGRGAVLVQALFEEAFAQHCGRQAVLDRLFEVVLVHVLRQLMEDGHAGSGMLAGLADARLRLALVAIHDAPAQAWSLEALAGRAGMSRSVFARSFHETVGCTPGQYLQDWRIALVQRGLRQGRPLKRLADEVGYGSEAALSRAFKTQVGQTPRAWRQAQRML
ncbi:MAG: AraC family transcriptional regulator [Pseudoxanthomonas sp.]